MARALSAQWARAFVAVTPSVRRDSVSTWGCAAIGAAVFAISAACLLAPHQTGQLSVVWPANALVLAMLLRTGRASWAKILLSGLMGNLAAKVAFGSPVFATMVLPFVNTLEIAICGELMFRVAGGRVDLMRARQLWAFVLSAGLAAPFAAGAVAAAVLELGHGDPFLPTLLNWGMTDALGLTIVTPALLALTPSALRKLGRTVRTGRGAASIVALGASLFLAFGQSAAPVLYLVPAALIFVAFELDQAGAALALLATWLVSTSLALSGQHVAGAARLDDTADAVMLQAFLATMTLVVLPVAAALASRRRIADDLNRKQAETEATLAKLSESEARYRLLTDRTVDLILRYDLTGRIEYVSPSAAKYGYRPDEMIGRRTSDFIHPESIEMLGERLVRLRTGESFEVNGAAFRIRRADGSWAWVEGNPAPIRDAAGAVLGVVTVVRDITQWRAMEDELLRRTAEAEAASDAKSEFLANMSHEIRTPLTAMIGFSGLLETAPELSDQSRAYVHRIARGGQALLAIVNDVLDVSRMEAGQIELAPTAFDPGELIAETADLVRDQAESKGLTLSVEAEDLPALVTADAGRLRQVLLNLLVNAIKFTSVGAVRLRVAHGGGRLRVAVTDTGEGVPEAQRHRLFQRFSQVDASHSRRHGGAGLGLAICKHLVELMGGEIGVDSREGAGSTFWFSLDAPLAGREPAGPVAAPPQAAPAPPPASAAVLVVDDVEANRELVRAMLEAVGHRVAEACDGLDAVEASARARYDVILMDMQMPRMDGLAATRSIRADCPRNRATPIVALTANVLCSQISACLEAGMDDHLCKPIAMADLLAKVAGWAQLAEQGASRPDEARAAAG